MIQVVEAIPMWNENLKQASVILLLSNPAWPEGTRQFTYVVNDNATLTLREAE